MEHLIVPYLSDGVSEDQVVDLIQKPCFPQDLQLTFPFINLSKDVQNLLPDILSRNRILIDNRPEDLFQILINDLLLALVIPVKGCP